MTGSNAKEQNDRGGASDEGGGSNNLLEQNNREEALRQMRKIMEDCTGAHAWVLKWSGDRELTRYLACTEWDPAKAAARFARFVKLKTENPAFFCSTVAAESPSAKARLASSSASLSAGATTNNGGMPEQDHNDVDVDHHGDKRPGVSDGDGSQKEDKPLKHIDTKSATELMEEYSDLLQRGVKFLPGFQDKEGRPVYVIRIGRVDTSTTDCPAVNRLDDLWLEPILDEPDLQSKGLCVIMDVKDYSLRLFKWLTPHNVNMSNMKMETGPIKQIRMHVVNSSRLVNAAIAIVYPLLSDKIKENIFFHGSDWQSLHRHIPPDMLPREYGGTGPEFDHESILDKLRKRLLISTTSSTPNTGPAASAEQNGAQEANATAADNGNSTNQMQNGGNQDTKSDTDSREAMLKNGANDQ